MYTKKINPVSVMLTGYYFVLINQASNKLISIDIDINKSKRLDIKVDKLETSTIKRLD